MVNIKNMKTITFTDYVTKHGHPDSDYKKDGTLKKNRLEPRDYCVKEKVSVKCKELVIDGKFIGYIRTDQEEVYYDIHGYKAHKFGPVYNENGEIVKCAFTTPYGHTIRYWGFDLFEGHNKKPIITRPSEGNGYFYPLWICDKNDNPLFIVKGRYENAKYCYAEDRGYYYDFRKYYDEFEEKYKNCQTIELEVSTYRDYYYYEKVTLHRR